MQSLLLPCHISLNPLLHFLHHIQIPANSTENNTASSKNKRWLKKITRMPDKRSVFCRAPSHSRILNQPSSLWGCCDIVPGFTVMTLIALKSTELLLSGTVGILSIEQMIQDLQMLKKARQNTYHTCHSSTGCWLLWQSTEVKKKRRQI